ncbi:MAG TPA: aminotransferase class V-fold PLP-dependent enzyme [Candidatus Limnocylindrales bacterium]|nr:aminotransferase class V-fold PLP-dependent enzyme [Candidatus Limnocylindrales bacterium]
MNDLHSQFMLDPDITFLNHGSFGACPIPVFEEYQRWQRVLERQPVELLGREVDGLLREAMTPLAAMLHADRDDCAFVPNATTGVNIVARSLKLNPDDEVLTTDHEYGACDYTWEYACAKSGAHYVKQVIPRPLDTEDAFIEALWAGVTPRTRVLFLSHITSPTALTFPIAPILRRAQAEGILTIVDGAHAPGQIPIDLHSLDPDFYTGNFHKWLCAPKSSAFLYTRKDHQATLIPSIISWGWSETSYALRQERQATRDPSAYLATPAALAYQQAHDWDAVRARCHELATSAQLGLAEVTGLPPLAQHDGWFAQMVAAELPAPPERAEGIKTRLYDVHRVEAPVTFQGGRIYIRASFQAYNSAADLERLLTALRETLAYVA